MCPVDPSIGHLHVASAIKSSYSSPVLVVHMGPRAVPRLLGLYVFESQPTTTTTIPPPPPPSPPPTVIVVVVVADVAA
ncbi:hypothetical protein M0804_002153 [Polistes exclamans]|nr:hypothetical protein M0804_002153 [Polistes exclamans]